MKLSEHKELKAEILRLSQKEKDKLLLRLIAKDRVLTERLHFLLLENPDTLTDRQEEVKSIIRDYRSDLKKEKYSSRNLLINLRQGLRLINHFYKVTKAKLEEVELRLFLFNCLLEDFTYDNSFFKAKNELLLEKFIIKSTLITLKKIENLHSDLQFDVQEDMNKLLYRINSSRMEVAARAAGLPKHV